MLIFATKQKKRMTGRKISTIFLAIIYIFTCLNTTKASAQESLYADTLLVSYEEQHEYRKVLERAHELLGARSKKMDVNKRIYVLLSASHASIRLGVMDSAVFYVRQAALSLPQTKDSLVIVRTWSSLSNVMHVTGKLDSSLFYTRKVLDYAVRNNEKNLLKHAYQQIASKLNMNGDYDEALGFYTKSMALALEEQDTSAIAIAYFNVGLTYANKGESEVSIAYLDSALFFAKPMKMTDLMAHTLGMKASALKALGRVDEWESNTNQAMQLSLESGNMVTYSYGVGDIMKHYLENGQATKVLAYGNKGLEILSVFHYPIIEMRIRAQMKKAYMMVEDYKMALFHDSVYDVLRDTVFTLEQKQALDEMVVKYELQEKKNEILQKDIMIARAQNKTYVLIGLVVLLLVSLVFITILNIQKRKKLRLLYEKEQQIDGLFVDSNFTDRQSKIDGPETDCTNECCIGPNRLIEYENLYSKMMVLLKEESLYLDPDLKQNDLVGKLSTNQKYLSEAISQFDEENFRSILNRLRIQKAKQLIAQENPGKPGVIINSQVYSSCGFNSNTSFYRAFKNLTGMTPVQYAKESQHYRELQIHNN